MQPPPTRGWPSPLAHPGPASTPCAGAVLRVRPPALATVASRLGRRGRVVLDDRLDDAEPQAGPRPDVFDADPLESKRLEAAVREQPEAAAEQHRHDIHPELVDEAGPQELADHVDTAHDRDRPVTGGRLRLADSRLDAVGHEGERQVLVLLRSDTRWFVGQHEDGHLELVVTDEPVRVVRHLERPSTHEDGACLLDEGVHVVGALEGRKVGIQAIHAAARIGHEAVQRHGHACDHRGHGGRRSFRHGWSLVRRATSSARRSMESLTPVSMPLWIMASRSSTDWKTEWPRSNVRPSRSSSTSESSATWPGSPSNSNVWTIPSGDGVPW